MVHSILLLGQSNMSGRGFREEVPEIENVKLKNFRNGRWWKFFVPVHWERKTCGICLAESFADAYSKDHPDVDVGMIPCADGGSSLSMWEPGTPLYDNAVFQAKLAMRTSNIVAILWHQGESDCPPNKYPFYEEKFTKIVSALRRDLDLPDVPFIVGGLGDYLKNFVSKTNGAVYGNYVHINAALEKVARQQPHMAFASAVGLTPNPDGLHFNAKSLREFGLRYYEQFRKIEDTEKVHEEKIDNTEHTEFEQY